MSYPYADLSATIESAPLLNPNLMAGYFAQILHTWKSYGNVIATIQSAPVARPAPMHTYTNGWFLVPKAALASIVSKSVTYQDGKIRVEAVLSRVAGLTAWVEKGGVLVSPPRSSLLPAVSHTLELPVQLEGNPQNVDVFLEVVNG